MNYLLLAYRGGIVVCKINSLSANKVIDMLNVKAYIWVVLTKHYRHCSTGRVIGCGVLDSSVCPALLCSGTFSNMQ